MKDRWPPKHLGDVLAPVVRRVSTESTTEYRLLGVRLEGEGPFLRETKLGAQISASSLNEVKAGDFIYSRLFAWRGAFGIINDELDGCYVSNEFPLFRPINDQIDIRFLNYWFRLRSVINTVEADCSGSTPLTRNRYKEEFFLRLEIPLPPLSEQRRIVAKIEQLAAKIEEARSVKNLSQRAIAALYEAGSTQCFDFRDNSARVGDFAKVVGGYAFKSDLYDENGSYQIVRIGNVRDGYLDLTRSPVYWNYRTDDARISKYLLAENDLVISMTGTRNKRDYGYVAIVPASQKLLLNQRVGKIELKADVDTHYMFHFLRSRFFRDRLFPNATGTANQANIGNEHIEQVPFAPPSFDEQRRIVAYLDGLQAQVNRLKALQAQTAAELEALLPSILDKAFKGEL